MFFLSFLFLCLLSYRLKKYSDQKRRPRRHLQLLRLVDACVQWSFETNVAHRLDKLRTFCRRFMDGGEALPISFF